MPDISHHAVSRLSWSFEMKQLFLAIQFLTIIPVQVKGDVSENDLVGAAAFFPVAGALQGLLLVITTSLLIGLFPPEIVSGFAILVHMVSDGGFDLDGLVDTFDGLAIKSSGDPQEDRDRRLSVMKDSTIGAMGAIAMTMTILLKFLILNALLHAFPLKAVLCVLFIVPVLSKWITVAGMYHGVPARQDGLGRIFIDHMKMRTVLLSTLTMAVLSLSALRLGFAPAGTAVIVFFFLLLVPLYLFCLSFVRFCSSRFGGLTGDNFGAMSEISEILLLTVGFLWLRHSI
jgi:adenosylcobinamide-GDP ribazoletransferase